MSISSGGGDSVVRFAADAFLRRLWVSFIVRPMKACIITIWMFLQASVAFGQGSLYTFSGTVSSLFYDGGGILAARNVAIGDPVSVSYIVDFGSVGYYLLNDGSVEVPTDPPLGNVHTTYFYCRLASGTLFPEANGGFNNGPQDVAEYFTGYNRSDPASSEGSLQGGSWDSSFSVRRSSPRYVNGVPYWVPDWAAQDWMVGTEVRGVIVAWSDQDWSIAWADMRLDSITPIPEPCVTSLLVTGIGGWYLWRKRRANKSVETNRRPASPFNPVRRFDRASCAPSSLSAAVAHLYRSAHGIDA